jgi:hypothetical protein
MENFRLIEFQLMRDFSEKLSTTISFVTQNFKALFRSLLYIAGPPVLVASMLIGSFIGDLFSLSLQAGKGDQDAMTNYFTSPNLWMQIGLVFVFVVVGVVVVTATVNNYLILYREKKTNKIEVNEVWERVRETFWTYLITTLLFGVFAILGYVVLLIPTFILGAISPFLIMFGILFFVGAFFYLLVSSSLIYSVQAFEKTGFIESLKRSFFLVRGKWWSTLAVYFVLSMLVGIISYIFLIPAYVIMFISSMHSINDSNFNGPSGAMGATSLVFMTLYFLCQMVLSCLPSIGLTFQYFNLVEMKEAKGLMGEIDTFGQTPVAPREEEHY